MIKLSRSSRPFVGGGPFSTSYSVTHCLIINKNHFKPQPYSPSPSKISQTQGKGKLRVGGRHGRYPAALSQVGLLHSPQRARGVEFHPGPAGRTWHTSSSYKIGSRQSGSLIFSAGLRMLRNARHAHISMQFLERIPGRDMNHVLALRCC